MCTTSEANRELALTRDTLDTLLGNIRVHMADADVVVGFVQTFCQLLMASTPEFTKQFSRGMVDAVLDGRRTHPSNANVLVWTLTFVHNVTAVSDDHRVYITRHSDGVALLLESRQRELKRELPIGASSGPGQANIDLCLEIAPARIPRY